MAVRNTNLAFARDEMLEAQLPPTSERGVIKWIRENLFSTPLNAALTLVALYVVYNIVAGFYPWISNSVWVADSQKECRDIVTGMSGEGATGACWALIRARWHQFMFGFYPPTEYWRPILTLSLLFVALAPVLFAGKNKSILILLASTTFLLFVTLLLVDGNISHVVFITLGMIALTALGYLAPVRLYWVTAVYPFLSIFLLWGGSFWAPFGALIGFVVWGLVYNLLQERFEAVVSFTLGLFFAAIWWFGLQGFVTDMLLTGLPLELEFVDSDRFGGFLLALTIGVSAIAASLPVGVLLALGRQSDMPLVKILSVGFIEFVRGVPLITMLFTASLLLQYFLPPRTNFDLILRVIILVTFFSAAYLAEVIRGGLAALPTGQFEAANALGLNYWQAQRLIIMPQALKVSIPGIVPSFIGLFKDTTLVAYVGLMDPLKGVTAIVRADMAWKGIYWEPYIFVGIIFFAFCFGMSRYSLYLENQLKTDHR